METVKFETGNIYEMTFIGDADLRPKFICVKRTEKSVTFEKFPTASEKITKKIKVWDNVEYIVTDNYSMAPSIKASRIVG
jgi:hypothetical protein